MLKIVQEIVRQRRRQLIMLGCLIVLGVVVYLGRVSLLQDHLLSARQEWSSQRLQVKQKTLLGKAEQYDAWVRDYALFAARVPTQREFARVVGELFEFAENNSLSVGAVTYKPEKSGAGYVEYKINMDVAGSYGGIKSFLADINHAREIMTIDTVGLNKGGKLFEDEVKLRVTLGVLFGAEVK